MRAPRGLSNAGSSDLQSDGFSIVEVIIAFFLLAIVAVAILPALFQGIRFSSQQSAVATATRELNALVEIARTSPTTCSSVSAVAATQTVTDGAGRSITTSGTVGTCPAGPGTVTIELTAVDVSGTTLASTRAIIFIP